MEPEIKSSAEALLLEAGRTYGITASRDELRQALDDPSHGAEFASWAHDHLNPENLLTAGELKMYAALDKSGEVDRLAALYDLAEIHAVTEDDMRTAIDELKRSTDSILQQADTMKQQQDALSRLVQKNAECDARRKDFEYSRQRRSDSDYKHIAAEVEDLSHSLDFRIADIEKQADESGSTFSQVVDSVLSSDDKLLLNLQKLGQGLSQQDPEETQTVEKLREVCMRLIKFTVETIRTKLDRVYLEALTAAERNGTAGAVSESEVKAMQEEVESLYSEILPVAQMAVEQQHLEPALKTISSQGGQNLSRTVAALTYVNTCLDFLCDRSRRLTDRLEAFRSHQIASDSILTTAKAQLSVPAETLKRPSKTAVPMSPVRPRAHTTAGGNRRRSSGLFEERPFDTLMQSLALFIDDEAETKAKVKVLSEAVVERTAKSSDVAQGAQESFENTANSHISDIQRALQLLKDSLLAESSYGTVRLMDPEVEESVDFLSSEVGTIKDMVDRAEANKVSGKSEKKAELLRRWGR